MFAASLFCDKVQTYDISYRSFYSMSGFTESAQGFCAQAEQAYSRRNCINIQVGIIIMRTVLITQDTFRTDLIHFAFCIVQFVRWETAWIAL